MLPTVRPSSFVHRSSVREIGSEGERGTADGADATITMIIERGRESEWACDSANSTIHYIARGKGRSRGREREEREKCARKRLERER